jgi:hypothetical protein
MTAVTTVIAVVLVFEVGCLVTLPLGGILYLALGRKWKGRGSALPSLPRCGGLARPARPVLNSKTRADDGNGTRMTSLAVRSPRLAADLRERRSWSSVPTCP